MCYHGGKQKVGKKLAEKLVEYMSSTNPEEIKGYCEPFVGFAGVYRFIPDYLDDMRDTMHLKYLAGDINHSVILMWKDLQKGKKLNTSCDEKKFNSLKRDSKPSSRKGFVGHYFSFSGIYFKGYRPKYANLEKKTKKNSLKRLEHIAKKLKNVKFKYGDYKQFTGLEGYIIYCDPPYSKYNEYYDENHKRIRFDSKKFWNWCRKMSKKNFVFVSEYEAPSDFKPIYTKRRRISYGNGVADNMEKLFFRTELE